MMFVPMLIGIGLSLVIGVIQYFLTPRMPEAMEQPSIDNIDAGLQFQSQYNTKTSQVPVPLIFGDVRVTGNIIYENMGGENNSVLYTCVGIGEAMMVGFIGQVYINDILWDDLPTAISDKSTLTKVTDGSQTSFEVQSLGTHGFGFQLDTEADEQYTYPITIYAPSAGVTVHTMVYLGNESMHVDYSIWYKLEDASTWTLFVSYVSEEEFGLNNFRNDTSVPHTWEYDERKALNAGKYQFKIVLDRFDVITHNTQEDDDGQQTWSMSSWVRLDTIFLRDVGITESIKFPQTAYVFAELTRDNSMPATTVIQADVAGIYSNPATCIYQLLTNAHWGAGIDPDYVSSTSLAAAVSFCDTYGYSFNRCVGRSLSLRDILSEMCLCGRLMLLDYDGQIHIQADDDAAAVKTIDDDDIIDLQYMRGSVSQSPTRIVGKFNDAEQDFTVQDVIAEDTSLQIARGYSKELIINLVGVTDRNIATSLAMFHLMKASNDRMVSVRTNINHSDLRPADIINISSADAGWVSRPHRIVGISEEEGFEIVLNCVPHFSEIYDAMYKSTYTQDSIHDFQTPKPDVYKTSLPNCIGLASTGPNYNIGETISCEYIFNFTLPASNCDEVEVWLSRGMTGVNEPNPYKMIGTSTSQFKYYVEEFFVQHIFKFVSRYGSRSNTIAESPTITVFPPPLKDIGFGVGNFGSLWWGY